MPTNTHAKSPAFRSGSARRVPRERFGVRLVAACEVQHLERHRAAHQALQRLVREQLAAAEAQLLPKNRQTAMEVGAS